MIAFLPAPVSTPFHAAAWSWCWLCAVIANVTTAGGTAPSVALRRRVDARPGRCATARFSSPAASATTARSPLSFCADAAVGTPLVRMRGDRRAQPLPDAAPRRARARRAARHHRSRNARRLAGVDTSRVMPASDVRRRDVAPRCRGSRASTAASRGARRRGRCVSARNSRFVDRHRVVLAVRRLTALLLRWRDGRPWSGRTRRETRRSLPRPEAQLRRAAAR